MQSGETPWVQDYFGDLQSPDLSEMEIKLQQLVEQGVISPEEAATVTQGSSAMNGVTLDPNLKRQQMDALSGLTEISDSGGMTDMDRANLSRISNEENAAARGQREAIINNANARGMGGSGLELMSQMQNQQDSATRKSQRDLDVAGMAQERALQALMQGGELAGNISAQDFNQQAQVAGANDAISQFNAKNQQNQINMNTGARNDAQALNLGNKQRVADANVGLRNQEQMNNKNLKQTQFDNELRKRGGQSGVATQNAQIAGQNSQNAANMNNQVIGIGATAAGTYLGGPAGGYAAKRATEGKKNGGMVEGEPTPGDSVHEFLQPGEFVVRKEDVPDMLKKMHTDDDGEFDAAGFLDQITGHKYGYSKKKMG